MKHILSLNDFLLEKLTLIDNDVNLIYNLYFKSDIEIINSSINKDGTENKIKLNNYFKQSTTDTSILKDKESIDSHRLNPCDIWINHKNNFYKPSENVISIGVNQNALAYVKEFDSLQEAVKSLPSSKGERLRLEFSEERFKGSIHHELVHWIDDTLHNRHIKKAIESGYTKTFKDVNLSKLEIQGIIHNIYQLKLKYSDIWDSLSFEDLISYSPSLSTIKDLMINKGEYSNWRRMILQRMNRENLLGLSMR